MGFLLESPVQLADSQVLHLSPHGVHSNQGEFPTIPSRRDRFLAVFLAPKVRYLRAFTRWPEGMFRVTKVKRRVKKEAPIAQMACTECQKLFASEASDPGRHHVGILGDIIPESPGGFVGIRSQISIRYVGVVQIECLLGSVAEFFEFSAISQSH
jgi:hypothetical protein